MMASLERAYLLAKANQAKLYRLPEYSLTIKSNLNLSLPLCKDKTSNVDIEISEKKNIVLPAKKNNSYNCFGDKDDYYYHKEKLLLVQISNGNKIFVKFLSELNEEIASNMILNIPLGYCLYQKSKFVLHASAFKKGSDSVLFMGESGSGKSSLVASLIESGAVMSEDLCLIDFNQKGDCTISPSLPFIKLGKEPIIDLKNKFQRLTEIPHDKRNRSFHYFQTTRPRKKSTIKNIYFLKWGKKFKIYKPDINEIFTFFNLCAFSCFPLDCCEQSAKKLFENITKISKSTNLFVLERNKKDFFDNNAALLKHISD